MASELEKAAKSARAERLVWARKRAGFTGPTPVSEASGINVNSYKAYEQGRNGFGLVEAATLAELFAVNLMWLMFGRGSPDADDTHVPRRAALDDLKREVQARITQASDHELIQIVEALESIPPET